MSPLDNLGINPGFLLVQIIAFIVLYTLLTRFLYDPLSRVLRERREKIAKGLEDADVAAQARKNAESEAGKVLAEARAEAAKIIEEARTRGDGLAQEIESAARTESDKIREDGRTSAETERNAQLADMRGQVMAIAVAVSQRLIGESLDEKRQQALIADFFTRVPDEARSLSGSVEVVSAMPLDEGERAKVKKETGADDVNFVVDPTILGGLVIRVGDRVVDGSVRSGLTDLAGRLN